MRCEKCGRPMKNAQMWQLGANPNAPTSRSMRQLCWECREQAAQPVETGAMPSILAEAYDVIRLYEARSPEQI